MSNAGYIYSKRQKKSSKNVLAEAIKLAEKEHGIWRTPKERLKEVTRVKQYYSGFVTKVSQSGRYGDDNNLHDTQKYFELMHGIEKEKHTTVLQHIALRIA